MQVAVGVGRAGQRVAQVGVVRVRQKPLPRCSIATAMPFCRLSRAREPTSMAVVRQRSSQQLSSRTRAVRPRRRVFLVIAVGNGFGGLVVAGGGEAGGVGGEEQQAEVGVELVGEDLVEVEFDVGLPR